LAKALESQAAALVRDRVQALASRNAAPKNNHHTRTIAVR
jgi:hypothetical protein